MRPSLLQNLIPLQVNCETQLRIFYTNGAKSFACSLSGGLSSHRNRFCHQVQRHYKEEGLRPQCEEEKLKQQWRRRQFPYQVPISYQGDPV